MPCLCSARRAVVDIAMCAMQMTGNDGFKQRKYTLSCSTAADKMKIFC